MGKVTEKIGKSVEMTAKAGRNLINENAKKAIKDMAKQKMIIQSIENDDAEETMKVVGITYIEQVAHMGAAAVKLTVKSFLNICKQLIAVLGIYSLFIFLPAVLIICCVGGKTEEKKEIKSSVISGGSYQYVSYSQTKYEAMYVDENGNTENGWCGVTAYADALASAGCKNESGELITPYDVRISCSSQYVSVGGWCAKLVSQKFPDVNYVYTIGYTRDWIDDRLSEGMMVGIYLSSRAVWGENYTGKTSVTSSAHWILVVGKISDTEYACINPADGSGDYRYVDAENSEYGSVGALTIDLSGIVKNSPSSSEKDIRICSGDSAGTADGKPRGAGYSPPAFAIGTAAGVTSVTLKKVGNYYEDENGNKYESLGDDWTITAYCPCEICCGENANGLTASMKPARANHTIAVDTDVIPMETQIVIDGTVYTAEDTGGAIRNHKIDIFMDSHEEASHYKKTNQTVYRKVED